MRTVPQVSGKVFTRRLFRGDSCHGAFMATVTIKCPVNGDDVPTDVLMDVESYETAIVEDN
ncbi:MAG: hypothetical protein QOD72_3529, partial [Acidimicrobiaceae bacterium]|nr:hypothetical protein [Acidimicrobiaceae bacterium]